MFVLLFAIACATADPQCVVFEDSCDCLAPPACVPQEEADAASSCDIDCNPDSRPEAVGTCTATEDGGCAFE